MIIKGKFRSFGFWFSLSSVLFCLYVLIYFIIFGLNKTPLAGQIFFYGVLIMAISIYTKLLYDANLITIETESRTINFVNIFTWHRSIYNFSDFDGKLIWYEPIKGGYAKNYYLIKNKKVVKKISGFIYSNQKELEDALYDIKDLGVIKYSYVKSWKVFFGFPILD